MPKSYGQYTSYPEDEDKLFRDAYDGKVQNLNAFIKLGDASIYQRTKFSVATPLFLAICCNHYNVIDLLLSVYRRDLAFIESYFQTRNMPDRFYLKRPILIAFGPKEITQVNDLYREYLMGDETPDPVNTDGIVVLLKINNLKPKCVLYLTPHSADDKLLVLKIIRIVLHNGQLYLNGCNNIGDSMIQVTAINGLYNTFQKLVDLNCEYDAVELARLAMKSGQVEFLDEIINQYGVDLIAVAENENDLFNLIGTGEWKTFEWVVGKLIELNRLEAGEQVFWKDMLDLCSCRYYGGTLYHYAIICDQIEFVEKYLAYMPNLKLSNRDGNIPIHHALRSARYKSIVTQMIESDDELLIVVSSEHKNVLHLMVEQNWCDILKEMAQKYVGIGEVIFRDTEVSHAAINLAICQKYTETVKYMLEVYREEFSYVDLYSFLHTAVRANANDIMDYILTLGKFDVSHPTVKGEHPVILSLCHRNYDMYLALIYQNGKLQRNLHKITDSDNHGLLWYTIWSRDHFEDIHQYEKFNRTFDEFLIAGMDATAVGRESGQSLVHRCAAMGNDTILKSLLSINLDINEHDEKGNLPIHLAVNLETFKMLNEHSETCQINVPNKFTGDTPLHMLLMTSTPTNELDELLDYMLANGANVNAVNHVNRTPLHLVRNVKWCHLLLQHGANVNATDKDCNTPLHTAFGRFDYKVAMMLFEQNIELEKVNSLGFNYLGGLLNQDAAVLQKEYPHVMQAKNSQIIQLVCMYCNSYNHLGTPLLIQSMYRHELLCGMILADPNCDVNIRDKQTHRTAIHATAMYKSRLIDRLIELGADINDRDVDGNTPLHHCCQFFHNHAIEYLNYGARVDLTNNKKETALHYVAVADMHGDTVCEMLLRGANLAAENSDGNMPYDLLRDDLKQLLKIFLQ